MPGKLSRSIRLLFSDVMSSVVLQLDRLRAFFSDSWRLRPLQQADEHARASERHRRLVCTAVAATLGRVISLGTSLITMRLTLASLGTERFGLWMTISSLQAFLVFADMGIGNGVLNAVAEANGKDDRAAIRRYIENGLLLLGGVAAVILLVAATTFSRLQFGWFFNLHSRPALEEVTPALFIFVACFALDIPAGLIQRVQLGLQLGFMSSIWQIAGSIAALAGVLVVVHRHSGLPGWFWYSAVRRCWRAF